MPAVEEASSDDPRGRGIATGWGLGGNGWYEVEGEGEGEGEDPRPARRGPFGMAEVCGRNQDGR